MVRKPNLIIAGAQKSGTSWLHAQLRQHPAIFMPAVKELGYFNRMDKITEAEYLEHFTEAGDVTYIGEATPHYFWKKIDNSRFSETPGQYDVATEMHRLLGPDLQLVLSLRDPVSRAISGWHHNICMGRNLDHIGILDCPASMGLVDLGMYERHWMHFENLFGRANMHVVLYDDLVSSPRDYLAWVLHLLNLTAAENYFAGLNLGDRVNTRAHLEKRLPDGMTLPKANPDELAQLMEMYQPHIAFTEQVSGRNLEAWRDIDSLCSKYC